MSPKQLYRTVAIAEAVTWTLLLGGMFLKYVTETTELGVRIGGGLHGFAFLAYVAITMLVSVDGRWAGGRLVAGLVSAVVPYLTVPFERSAERAGLLSERWRLRTERPATHLERPVALGLRSPVLAGLVVMVALALVFGGLLAAGPPTEWGS
jgi:integral membrane protein